ncbi:small GTP-binding protein [Tritrichomonas foetus]|uniref:Small GTP-binding protein n=1 Tax=Tritrichomonas foetus TaxID=1144522 RepID=A0A1J4KGZ6_9EUKA|nr:small GTP-binding protein [Tritrichomonas foetus]|eukprot:OHT10467.1 small GTP-binding protein [Tritrichomonas foetus]
MDPIEIKLVIVGNTSVGKTCIVKKATSGQFSEDSVPTLGASFISKLIEIDRKPIRVQIWDTAGQERYRGMTPMYYRGAHCAAIVFSLTDRQSFESVDGWIQSLNENAPPGTIIFLVANKVDMESDRIIQPQDGQAKADKIGAIYFEVSAKTGFGIDELFTQIPMKYLEAKGRHNSTTSNDKTVDLKSSQSNKKQCC